MTYEELLQEPASKKILFVEIDTPIVLTWINEGPGLWGSRVTPGNQLIEDDNGNFGYWGNQNTQFYNIGSLNVNGELYTQVFSISDWETTNKSWYYDKTTTDFKIHLDGYNPPELFNIISPGAILGFTDQIDSTTDNYFDGVYYMPLVRSVPNLSKKKDALFFGLLQYQGGLIGFDNAHGEFDNFSNLDLYGQPVRIKMSFEGLDFSQANLAYTGRVGEFSSPNFTQFNLRIADIREFLSRKLPINSFNKTDYPSISDSLVGVPIPISFGPSIKAPAYKTSSGNWTFYDDEFLTVDSGITVYRADDSIFSHGGTETDGTFTGTDTDEQLTVSYNVSKKNGLNVISFIIENYENIEFNSSNYDLTEWNNELVNVSDIGYWFGRGNLKTAADLIQQVCGDNQGIFDVLADGRFTFRTLDKDKEPVTVYEQDEIIGDPSRKNPTKEVLSSVKVEYSRDLKTKEAEIFTNLDYQKSVYARFQRYKERSYKTALTNEIDAETLSVKILDLSQNVLPEFTLLTKTQKLGVRILDNAAYTYKRIQGDDIIPLSSYQVIGLNLNLTAYQITSTISYLKELPSEPSAPSDENGAVYGIDVYGIDVYGL